MENHDEVNIVEQLLPSVEDDPHYRRMKCSSRISFAEIGLGAIAIILSLGTAVVSPQSIFQGVFLQPIGNSQSLTHTFQGIWSGFALLVSGITAICSKKYTFKHMAVIEITIVLATVAAVFSALILSVLAATSFTSERNVLAAIHATIAIASIFGVTVTIIHACFIHRTIYLGTSNDIENRPSDAFVRQSYHLPQQVDNRPIRDTQNSAALHSQHHVDILANDHIDMDVESHGKRNVHDVSL